jgi:cell division protein FtsB
MNERTQRYMEISIEERAQQILSEQNARLMQRVAQLQAENEAYSQRNGYLEQEIAKYQSPVQQAQVVNEPQDNPAPNAPEEESQDEEAPHSLD